MNTTQTDVLAKHLSLEDPTIEQFNQVEAELLKIVREAGEDIAAIDEDARAHAADRLLNRDTGLEARTLARIAAVQRKEDAEITLNDVRMKRAALQCRLEKEADEAAWGKAREALKARREVMGKIDALLEEVAVLNNVQQAHWNEAEAAAPVKIQRSDKINLVGFGRDNIESGIALMARLHVLLGVPQRIRRLGLDETFMIERRCGDGLVDFLETTENALLKNQV